MPDPLEALRLPVVPVEPRPEFAAALLRRIQGQPPADAGRGATVRYLVTDIGTSVAFYRDLLGFEEELVRPPAFAMLYRGDLRLLLSAAGGAEEEAAAAAEGAPEPGGWNRIALQVPDLAAAAGALRREGAVFRSGAPAGVAIRRVLLEDPSGNLVELFEPAAGYHERGPGIADRPAPGPGPGRGPSPSPSPRPGNREE
jgi:catechol 2,3-dioxygenase-like lactoylglutathione lyase family enzyme